MLRRMKVVAQIRFYNFPYSEYIGSSNNDTKIVENTNKNTCTAWIYDLRQWHAVK